MKKILILITLVFTSIILCDNMNALTIEAAIEAQAPNGIVKANGIDPSLVSNNLELQKDVAMNQLYNFRMKLLELGVDDNTYIIGKQECTDAHHCELNLELSTDSTIYKKIQLTMEYENIELTSKENADLKNILNNIKLSKLEEQNNRDNVYVIEDLEAFNAWIANPFKYEETKGNALTFMQEFTKSFNNTNFDYDENVGAGGGMYFSDLAGKTLFIYRNGNEILKLNIPIYYTTILYIPTNTPNTKEAYIEAANKKIQDYMPNNNIEITYGGSIKNDLPYEKGNWTFDLNKTQDNYYLFTIKGENNENIYKTRWLILPSDTQEKPTYEKTESTTGINIKTPAGEVPLDSIIKVEDLSKVKDELEKASEKILTTIHKIFDISLYSETKGENITKLETGMFQVTIPLGKEYLGKSLSAYYIHDNGELEEHEITLDEEGNATFETNHFSTYIIAENNKTPEIPATPETPNIEVPNTIDNISNYFELLIISIISLLSLTIYIKKSNIEK